MAPVDLKKLKELHKGRTRALEALPLIGMTESPAITKVWEALPALIRRVERLTAALRVYADEGIWTSFGADLDQGQVAREALKEDPDSVGPTLICVDSSCPCDGGDCGCFSLCGDKICVVKI